MSLIQGAAAAMTSMHVAHSDVGITIVAEPAPVTVYVPTGDLDRMRQTLDKLEVGVRLCQRILSKSDEYGEERVLAGVRQVLQSLNRVIKI